MKANKAPEKIYVNITHPISDEYTEMIAFEDGDGIEYTRTDAFIEKAAEWIKNKTGNYIVETHLCSYFDYKRAVEDFIKYMEGE